MPTEPATAGAVPPQLFVYGSLVDPRTLDCVLGYRFSGERCRARLVGYERVMSPAYGYPFLVANPNAFVDGVLLTDLNEGELDVLDRYEDVADEVYARAIVEVEAWGCGAQVTRTTANTYIGGRRLAELIPTRSTVSQPDRNV
jgi:gamma-glutamylcyclotransferase (GGCT)/AIG2-like uncharacterized protein YtfP